MHPSTAKIPTVSSSFVSLRYAVRPQVDAWVLPEGQVPESVVHDRAAERLKSVLFEWARTLPRPVTIARNLAVRWLEASPRVGIDPDVCVLDPPPPGIADESSLRLWCTDHRAPTVCFEIVSPNHPHKDYRDVHERYAALGAAELVVFDPLLAGPPSLGGPISIQLWRRDDMGGFVRVYAGRGPVYCEGLDAFLGARDRHLMVSTDARGEREWLPSVESAERERAEKERERAERERERAEKERERAARQQAEFERGELARRVEALEARLARPSRGSDG